MIGCGFGTMLDKQGREWYDDSAFPAAPAGIISVNV